MLSVNNLISLLLFLRKIIYLICSLIFCYIFLFQVGTKFEDAVHH
ncbi:unnamed protein product [Brugia timori]|uniref:Uncharacterized protein n=1 Tax=Brugia timori TaxID=42155 RepID=A0A3P7TYI9_9BILA|nr:unnamed protein product [Brugia timori]